jgi:hypothetical protein
VARPPRRPHATTTPDGATRPEVPVTTPRNTAETTKTTTTTTTTTTTAAPPTTATTTLEQIEAALHRLFIGAEATALRKEDRQKARELVPLLHEIRRAAGQRPRGVLVDLCAGKSALGLLAATLVLPRQWRVVVVERDPARAAHARAAVARARAADDGGVDVEVVVADVGEAALPVSSRDVPVVAVALHACGPASDAIIDRCVRTPPSTLLLVPCCYGAHPATAGADHAIPGQRAAAGFVDVLPRQGLVGRKLAAALIDAERTLRLEEGGFAVEVVEFVAATVTPHNLLWRARRVDEAPRRERAQDTRRRLLAGRGDAGSSLERLAPQGPASMNGRR